jgi:hypothetical protein
MKQKIATAMDFLELVGFKILGAPGPVTSGLMATLQGGGRTSTTSRFTWPASPEP